MNPIRRLDPVVVDQIAAGEVVERPASVVKELVENALDAGATRVEVRLAEGGRRRIEVRDDGGGVPAGELLLAVTSHATSKLRSVQDLDAIATLGFRGEALASIGAVSRLDFTSRTGEAAGASAVQVRFGRVEGPRDAAGPRGTRVVVEDLFLETPARLKFLKRAATELGHAAAWVERLALAHLGVAFVLENDGKTLLQIAAADDLEARLGAVLGGGLASHLVAIAEQLEGYSLDARIGPPESARRHASGVHLYLNGRWVRDARLLAAVREGVREFVPSGHYPALYLALALPPDRVDVNVHPQKIEVRLRDERLVLGGIVRALQRGLAAAPWATRSVGAVGAYPGAAVLAPPGAAPPTGGFPPAGISWERPLERSLRRGAGVAETPPGPDHGAGAAAAATPRPVPELPFAPSGAAGPFLSVARTFLVREVPGGLEILDQHALHERVNLEELRREARSGEVLAQPLLVPALVDVDRSELELLLAQIETWRRLGVQLDAFGEKTVAIRSVPARLTRLVPERLVADLVELARQHREATPDQLVEESLQRLACRGAVMAGDALSQEDLLSLLRRGAHLPQDRTCAHGRPVRVLLSLADLERAFYRR